METTTAIARFFEEYEARFNDTLKSGYPNTEAVAGDFADCFVESSPVGVICGKNDDTFRERMATGYDFYRKIGITAMYIRANETEEIDPCHVMTRVRWESLFTRKDGSEGH